MGCPPDLASGGSGQRGLLGILTSGGPAPAASASAGSHVLQADVKSHFLQALLPDLYWKAFPLSSH
jgi:hypothetical protein